MATASPAQRQDAQNAARSGADDPGSPPARLIISCAYLHSALGPGCPHCPPRLPARTA
jgi:hypothetical protein